MAKSLADMDPALLMARVQKQKAAQAKLAKGRDLKLWITLGTLALFMIFSTVRTVVTILLFGFLATLILVRRIWVSFLPGSDGLTDVLFNSLLNYFWGWYGFFWFLWLLVGGASSRQN